MKLLLTCPPMITQIDYFESFLKKNNWDVTIPKFTSHLNESELLKIIDKYDTWIAGDDPVCESVIKKGKENKLRVIIKWGVGTDNIDYEACHKYGIYIDNTPGLFGEEVSDIAINYLLTLTRKTHLINSEVRKGNWFKPSGMSLVDKKICLLGFGNIGSKIARKLLGFGVYINIYDPGFFNKNDLIYSHRTNQEIDDIYQTKYITLYKNKLDCVNDCDIIICACNLTPENKKMVNRNLISKSKKGVILINVSRGLIINEKDVIEMLTEEFIQSVGLDVFETEPLSTSNKLLQFNQNIYGSHNSSNTIEGVREASQIAIDKIKTFFNKKV